MSGTEYQSGASEGNPNARSHVASAGRAKMRGIVARTRFSYGIMCAACVSGVAVATLGAVTQAPAFRTEASVVAMSEQ